MAEQRNVRKQYYRSIGVNMHGMKNMDVRASFNALLSESIMNVDQILKLSLEFGGTPPSLRSTIWPLVLGMLPLHVEVWDFVRRERESTYQDILLAGSVMEHPQQLLQSTSNSCSTSWHLVRLFLIYHQDILGLNLASSKCISDTQWLLGIANVMVDIFPQDADRFWCLVGCVDILEHGWRTLRQEHHRFESDDKGRRMFYDIQSSALEKIVFRLIADDDDGGHHHAVAVHG